MTDPKAQPGPFDGLPAFQPLADDLPPQMKAALVDLRKALTEPASLDGKFPFKMPTAHPAPVNKGGRPSHIQPNQVVRLVRFMNLGFSVRQAAKRCGLPESSARQILSGQCAIAHHPAVTAAGVELPARREQNPRKTVQAAHQAPNASSAGVGTPPPPALPQINGADLKTAEEVRAEFEAAGISVSEWARHNGFSRELVAQVLDGKLAGTRGQSHKIKLALGMKTGAVVSAIDFKPASKGVA